MRPCGQGSRFFFVPAALLRCCCAVPLAEKARAHSPLPAGAAPPVAHTRRWLVLVDAGGAGPLVETVSDRLRCTRFAPAILPQHVSVLTATCTVSRAAWSSYRGRASIRQDRGFDSKCAHDRLASPVKCRWPAPPDGPSQPATSSRAGIDGSRVDRLLARGDGAAVRGVLSRLAPATCDQDAAHRRASRIHLVWDHA